MAGGRIYGLPNKLLMIFGKRDRLEYRLYNGQIFWSHQPKELGASHPPNSKEGFHASTRSQQFSL